MAAQPETSFHFLDKESLSDIPTDQDIDMCIDWLNDEYMDNISWDLTPPANYDTILRFYSSLNNTDKSPGNQFAGIPISSDGDDSTLLRDVYSSISTIFVRLNLCPLAKPSL